MDRQTEISATKQDLKCSQTITNHARHVHDDQLVAMIDMSNSHVTDTRHHCQPDLVHMIQY